MLNVASFCAFSMVSMAAVADVPTGTGASTKNSSSGFQTSLQIHLGDDLDGVTGETVYVTGPSHEQVAYATFSYSPIIWGPGTQIAVLTFLIPNPVIGGYYTADWEASCLTDGEFPIIAPGPWTIAATQTIKMVAN